ncbi:MAG: site-2 protease family protein [Chloroflexi bacterium]|nr:site-2 protease family protein [Chloroflexota bacterium]
MLINSFDLLIDDPAAFVVQLLLLGVAFLAALSIHEFGHAFVAYRLGDTTAQRMGRLTLNPRAHLDPTGTVMLLLAGFGWGKPVQVNPRNFRNGRPGMAMVAVAGPGFNVLLAILLALPFQTGLIDIPFSFPTLTDPDLAVWVSAILTYGVFINVILAVFNLLPFSPLDGSQILMGVAPRQWLPYVLRLQVYGPMLLVAVVMLDIFLDLGIIGRVIFPVVNWATTLLLG